MVALARVGSGSEEGRARAGPCTYPRGVDQEEDADGGEGDEHKRLAGHHLDGRPGVISAAEGLLRNHRSCWGADGIRAHFLSRTTGASRGFPERRVETVGRERGSRVGGSKSQEKKDSRKASYLQQQRAIVQRSQERDEELEYEFHPALIQHLLNPGSP